MISITSISKGRQISQKKNICYPLILTRMCAYRGNKCLFLGKFGVFRFHMTLIFRVTLLPYYRQIVNTFERSANL